MISHDKIKDITLDTIDHVIAPQLRHWRNSPQIFNWCRQNDLISEEMQDGWMKNHPLDPRIKMYLIRSGGTAVGVCGLTDLDLVNQRAEFSLYIGPEFHGNGFGEKALRLLIWHGFNSYPLHVIWGETFDGNPAIKMFEKIGFKKEGTRRDFYFKFGEFIDCHLLSIKRDEFKL